VWRRRYKVSGNVVVFDRTTQYLTLCARSNIDTRAVRWCGHLSLVSQHGHTSVVSLEPHRHGSRIERLADVRALAPAHPPRHDAHARGLGLAHVARERGARLLVGTKVRVRVWVWVTVRVWVWVWVRVRVRVRVWIRFR
jgi:hypothetical protein